MDFFADLLIAAGAIGVAVFCFVLSRRLKALGRLDSGIGGAIAVLAQQVDDLTRALKAAQATARDSAKQLEGQTQRADAACRQLELLMASLHDLPPPDADDKPVRPRAKAAPDPDAAFPTARPLSRWNTNRLRSDAEPAEAPAEAPAAPAVRAPSARAKTLAPAEPPAKIARRRVVRRRHSVGARA